MQADLQQYLDQLPELPDEEIDIGLASLALAARWYPERSMDRYVNHIEEMTQKTGEYFTQLCQSGASDSAATRLAALKEVVHNDYGYTGDQENYNSLDNTDMVQVIERRKGLPVAIAILYITCGRRQGWQIYGLNFPAHFITRIDYKGERIIFDPFNKCNLLEAPDLRKIIKDKTGPQTELSAEFYAPLSQRAILIRLQNNRKLRFIEAGDYKNALDTVEVMLHIDPAEFRLFLDAGVLYARCGQKKKAVKYLEDYINETPNAQDREEAALMLRQLKQSMV